MAEIFTTPLLPYKEFLVTYGKHGAALMEGGKLGDHYHARYEFPCGTEVSVISGPLFYCSIDAPYEYRIGGGEPVGHQTDEELYILLTRIVAGEKPEENKEGYMGGDADHTHQDPVFENYDVPHPPLSVEDLVEKVKTHMNHLTVGAEPLSLDLLKKVTQEP
jgi:hypothetical protein